jgi:hypothetical protein
VSKARLPKAGVADRRVGSSHNRRDTIPAVTVGAHMASTVLVGLVGGLVATMVMTITMMLAGDGGPPPTAALVAKVAGGDPTDHEKPGMLLHLLYGTVAGAVFALALPVVGFGNASVAVTTGLGLLYGLILMVGGVVVWVRLIIGIEPDRAMATQFGVVHAVYGVVLGAIVGAGLSL